MDEGALTLEQDLMVSETEAFYFGSVSDVAVGRDGRMYVLDGEASHVKMLRSDGTLIDSVGGSGQGPGEFGWARQIVVARGDSLYVLDAERDRISVFDHGGVLAYGSQVGAGGTFPDGFFVPERRSGFVLFNTSFSESGSTDDGTFLVRWIDGTGRTLDTVLTARMRESIMIDAGPRTVSVSVPFGRGPNVYMGSDDRVYFGRNDSVHLVGYSLSGARSDSISIPHAPIPISDEERTESVEGRTSDVRSQILDAMPETKPAFDDVFVDDRGRFWFGRPTADPDTTEWWVADPEEARVASARVSSEIDIETVRDGFAYGDTNTETGAPALVRYEVAIEE